MLIYSYKGMAQAAPASSARNITPQATGFSQVHSRGGGEGGGQAMSVLLSWHEKVRSSMSCLVHQPFECHLGMILPLLARTTSMTVQAQLLTTAIACGGSRSRKHRQGHDGSPHSMSRSNVLSPYVLCADHSRCRTRTTPSTRQAARALCPTANMLLLVINYSRHTNNLHHAQLQPAFSPVLRCDLLYDPVYLP
jgi:hypothetical protein